MAAVDADEEFIRETIALAGQARERGGRIGQMQAQQRPAMSLEDLRVAGSLRVDELPKGEVPPRHVKVLLRVVGQLEVDARGGAALV